MRGNNNKIFFLTDWLDFQYGGRTKSIIRRAKLLTELGGIPKINILTVHYDPDIEFVYKDFEKKNKRNEKMIYSNIYEDIKRSKGTVSNNYLKYLKKTFNLKKLHKFKGYSNSHVVYYYNEGRPIFNISYDPKTQMVRQIDVFEQGRKDTVKRLLIDRKGNIHRIRYFSQDIKISYVDTFLNDKGKVYLTKEYSPSINGKKLDRIIYYPTAKKTIVFQNETEFFFYWFNQIINANSIVVSDVRRLDPALFKVDKPIKRIFQLHNYHYKDPLNVHSPLRTDYKALFDELKIKNGTMITLTPRQKNDICSLYPSLIDKTKIVPHSISKPVEYHVDIKKRIVVVSRLAAVKRIDHVIQSFKLFHEKKSDIILEVYGEGEAYDELKHLIEHLELDSCVFLKGNSNEVDKLYQSSLFSVSASFGEGLGLSVMESLNNGCPVVAYASNYGPSDLIHKKTVN
jgi:poly(glycerol-phosphate) alpha-glucosyltransferase